MHFFTPLLASTTLRIKCRFSEGHCNECKNVCLREVSVSACLGQSARVIEVAVCARSCAGQGRTQARGQVVAELVYTQFCCIYQVLSIYFIVCEI